MNSIVLNPKVAACEMFYSFTSFITFKGEDSLDSYILCAHVGTNDFYWEVCKHIFTTEGYRNMGVGEKVFSYKFSRNACALRSSDLGDHFVFFNEEFRRFHSLFLDNESVLTGDKEYPGIFKDGEPVVGLTYDEIINILKPSQKTKSKADAMLFTNWHTSKEIPDIKEEGAVAHYVLIDLYGYRKPEDFEIGFYNITQKRWCLKYSNRYPDLDHMKWTELPLNREQNTESLKDTDSGNGKHIKSLSV